jgi:cobalt-zinc-cadmium efflux system outer membrane protein
LIVVLMTTNSYADTNSTTLDSLVVEVLEKNPELQFFQAEIASAKGSRKTAGLWTNPEVSGSIGQKRVWNEEEELTAKGKAGDIAVTQTFEWPGRIGLRKAIADRDIELAALGLEQFRALLVSRTKVAAYELLAAQEKASATREVADHFSALREVLVQRGQAGLAPQLETRVIEAIELNMQRKASQASLAAQAALFDLNQLRGASPDAKLSLAPLNLSFRPLEKNQDALVTLAKSNDFLVRQKKIELARQKFRVGLAENERLPAVSVGPSISQERAGDRERVIAAAISVPLPIWDRNQGNIDTARAQRVQAETSFNIAESEAQRHVIEAMTSYETKLKEMAKWQPDSIQHFKEAAELADRHYRLGAVPVSTYLELQTQYLETIEGLLDTKKEALEAANQLNLLTGTNWALTESVAEKEAQ